MSILGWLPLLRAAAGRLAARLPAGFDRHDLEQASAERLLRYGVDTRTPAGYVAAHARGAMRDELRAHDPVSRSVRRLLRRVDAAGHALLSEGVRPTPEAIAARAGVSVRQVMAATEALSRIAAISADAPTLDAEAEPDATAERRQSAAVLARAVDALPAPQREVMQARLSGESPTKTAERLGLKYHAVRGLQDAAMRLLRHRLRHALG